jgi:hypothetical protein
MYGDQLLKLETGLNKPEGLSLATEIGSLSTTVKLPVPALQWKASIIVAHSLQ